MMRSALPWLSRSTSASVLRSPVFDLSGLPEIHSLWIGPRLTWIELLSLHSWLEHGRRVILWCYEPIEAKIDFVITFYGVVPQRG
jgi:hypothetical protein